ncbi:MAG: tetratricopeptide repeat protein [Elusimicrobia bacterium]|nr:tetratricopeptide repeat protein [Elusimicrobiota bacterium]
MKALVGGRAAARWSRRCCRAAMVLLAVVPAALAGRTEPGQETIWDQILASQASRGMRVGSRYMDLQQYDLAESEFARAVAASPNDPTARLLLGAAYYWRGNVDGAIVEYRKAIGLDGNNAQAWMLLGIAMAWKGEAAAALEAFTKAGQFDPKRADIQMNLGSIEETMGRNIEALGHFRKAVALEPSHPLYHFQLGMLYRRLGRDGDAIESMEDALRLYTHYEDALLELGAAQERLGQTKAAVQSFRRAVALKSRDAVARFRLGRLHLLTGDKTLARDAFVDAFHLTPEGEGSGLQLSVSFAGGKKNAASSGGGGKGAASPGPGEGGSRQPAEAPAGEADTPLGIFQRNLQRIPLERSAFLHVDAAFLPKPKLEKVENAESRAGLKAALEKGMRRPSDRASAKVVRREYDLPAASQEAREKQIEKILNDLAGVLGNAPEDTEVRLGMNLTFKRMADVSSDRSDSTSQAKVSFQPRQVGNDMGLWVIGTGWMTLVEEVLPEPGDRPEHPDDPDWWVAAGLGYATVGDGQRAMAAFESALRLNGSHEVALLGRGVAAVMTGDEARATADYRRVLQLNPKNRPAAEGLKWLQRPTKKKS